MQPTSYKQIYKYIEQVCNECSIFIDTIEIDYYQGSSSTMIVTSPDQRTHRPLSVIIIQTWSQQLKQLQKVCYSKDIQNSTTARELIKEATLGSSVRFINNESIILMQRIDSKIREQLQFKIPILVEQISNCLKIMKQYCLSFYTIENVRRIIQKKQEEKLHDEDLETPYTYEKSRWLHIFQINQSLKILREMSQRIQHTEGVKLASLSKECQDLAYRCNCTTFPYIFVLSECYYQARQALNSLRTWLPCSTISKLIGHDWNRFYWQLPFYPRRGQEELFEDLKRIDRKYQRGNIFQDQAMEALNKWRRFHTRARVDDLIHGLRQIHRVDIVQSIEQSISKPKCLLDDDDDDDDDEIDLQKKEIEDLNQKLIRLFEKLRNNTTTITEES
ncbi:hypothetical protein I4U23_012732 [Adineta vaga]|nr:hypothetical protein I4U23_012732 [Adineta vaga]